MPSPGHSDDDVEDDDDEVEGLDLDEDHVYQSLERPNRADDNNAIYAVPLKQKKVSVCVLSALSYTVVRIREVALTNGYH